MFIGEKEKKNKIRSFSLISSRRTAIGFFSRKFQTRIEPSLEQEARYLLQGLISMEFISDLWLFNVARSPPFSADHSFMTLFMKKYEDLLRIVKIYEEI